MENKSSHGNAHRAKDHRPKKRCTPNGRVKLQDDLVVAVPRTRTDTPKAGVSKEVEDACADFSTAGVSEEVQDVGVDSLAAGVSMEVQEVDDDSGDELCRFFGGKGATIPARKANMTPDDIVKGLDAWHEFLKKHGANKNKFIQEVMRAHLPNGLKHTKFDKTTLKQWIKKEPEYCASSNLARSRDRRQGITHQRDGNYPEMELKLGVNVKHLQALGLCVDKHLLKLEQTKNIPRAEPPQVPVPTGGVI